MLKLCVVTKVKVFFLVLVYVFNFDLFEFSAAILKKGLLEIHSTVLCVAELYITLELARGTNIPRKKIPNNGPPQIPKMLYAN